MTVLVKQNLGFRIMFIIYFKRVNNMVLLSYFGNSGRTKCAIYCKQQLNWVIRDRYILQQNVFECKTCVRHTI